MESLLDWKFYVFLYLAFSIGSAIRLSPSDLHAAEYGFGVLFANLFLLNLVFPGVGDMVFLVPPLRLDLPPYFTR